MIGSIAAAYFALGHAEIGSLKALLEHPNLRARLAFSQQWKPIWTAGDGCESRSMDDLDGYAACHSMVSVGIRAGARGRRLYRSTYAGSGERAMRLERYCFSDSLITVYGLGRGSLWPWHRSWCFLLESIRVAFRKWIPAIGHDMAYPAMLTFLPSGWWGWFCLFGCQARCRPFLPFKLGSSYVANDFYKRFVKPKASGKELVLVGRISTAVMMVLAGILALNLKSFGYVPNSAAG